MDISKYNKAEVLAALYNNSKPQGFGFMQSSPLDMTKSEAEELLSQSTYFDYLQGRVMKICLEPDTTELDTRLYNQDNGHKAAERAIESIGS